MGNAQMAERSRRVLDNQVKDMQTKLDEAEQLAVKGGKKVVSRLEQKIKDLEGQLDDEQRRLVDAQKSQRRTGRRVKELTFSQDEDQKNHERMQELVDKLHQLLHPLVVLLVLVLGEGQLLHPPLGSSLGLLGIHQASLLVIELALEVLDLL